MQHVPTASSQIKRRRLRAKRAMMLLGSVCALVALSFGAYELHAEGLNQFLYRAPGVGASK